MWLACLYLKRNCLCLKLVAHCHQIKLKDKKSFSSQRHVVLEGFTWCGWNSQDFLTQLGVLLCWIHSRFCVKGLIHFSEHYLPQVEQT